MSRPSSSGAGLQSSSVRRNKSKPRKDPGRAADTTLDRANTTSAAIRRGDLKISGPIPIAQDDDEEFPLRNTDGLTLLQSPAMPNHSQASPQASVNGLNGTNRPKTATEPSYQVSVLGPEKSSKLRPKTMGAEAQVLRKPRASANSGSGPHDSTTSYATNPNSNNNRKSKGTSLGGIVRKLFGRKQRKSALGAKPRQAEGPQSKASTTPTAVYLDDRPHTPPRPATPQPRGHTSLSPLGSHSPFATNPLHMDNQAGPVASEPLPYLDDAPEPSMRPDSPTHPLPSNKATSITRSWKSMAQRPASAHNRAPRLFTPEPGEGGIGFAVTSGSNLKRRSRSAGAMRRLGNHAEGPGDFSRRRSAEIKYWRESGGYLTKALPEPDLEHQGERGTEGEEDLLPRAVQQGVENQLGQGPRPRHQNFSYISPRPDADDDEDVRNVDLEGRVTRLEDKMTDTEYAISKLRGRASRATVIIERPPSQVSRERSLPSRYSRSAERSSYYSDDHRVTRKRSSNAFDNSSGSGTSRSPTPPPKFVKPTALEAARTPDLRPISGSTIRAARSHDPIPTIPHPPSVSMSGLTSEHYTTLLSLILREQSARKRLEGQVTLLQREVEVLRAKSYDPAYPTPSPDLNQPVLSPQQTYMGGQGGQRYFTGFDGWGAREQESTDSEFVDDDEVWETPTEGRDQELSGAEEDDRQEIGIATMRGRALVR
ncbi:MAG: hypothetical protein M1812_004563 [Candelaria pacifica]|nr:MAG: hypothetical protein M1812_004563 [Candelaria pacifica]